MKKAQSWNLVALGVVLALLAVAFRLFRPATERTHVGEVRGSASPEAELPNDPATRMARAAIDETLQRLDQRQHPEAIRFGFHRETVRYDDPSHPDWYGEVSFDVKNPWGYSVQNLGGHCRLGGWHHILVRPGTALIVARGVAGTSESTVVATLSILSDTGPVTGAWIDRCGQKTYLGELGTLLPVGQWFPVVAVEDTPGDIRIDMAVREAMQGSTVFWKINNNLATSDMNLEGAIVTTGDSTSPDFCTHLVTVTATAYAPQANQFVALDPPYVGYFKCRRSAKSYLSADAADYDAASAVRGFSSADVIACMTKAQLAFMAAANQLLAENSHRPGATDTCPIHIISIHYPTATGDMVIGAPSPSR